MVVVVVCECVTPFWFGVHSEACTALSSIACRRRGSRRRRHHRRLVEETLRCSQTCNYPYCKQKYCRKPCQYKDLFWRQKKFVSKGIICIAKYVLASSAGGRLKNLEEGLSITRCFDGTGVASKSHKSAHLVPPALTKGQLISKWTI